MENVNEIKEIAKAFGILRAKGESEKSFEGRVREAIEAQPSLFSDVKASSDAVPEMEKLRKAMEEKREFDLKNWKASREQYMEDYLTNRYQEIIHSFAQFLSHINIDPERVFSSDPSDLPSWEEIGWSFHKTIQLFQKDEEE